MGGLLNYFVRRPPQEIPLLTLDTRTAHPDPLTDDEFLRGTPLTWQNDLYKETNYIKP